MKTFPVIRASHINDEAATITAIATEEPNNTVLIAKVKFNRKATGWIDEDTLIAIIGGQEKTKAGTVIKVIDQTEDWVDFKCRPTIECNVEVIEVFDIIDGEIIGNQTDVNIELPAFVIK